MAVQTHEGQQAVLAFQQVASREEKKKVVEEMMTANPDLFPRSDAHRTRLWSTLLIGLFVIALVSIVGSIVLAIVDDGDMTALIALASAVVAGVIGLFSNPPTSR